jgi:poly(A) polymerase
MNKMKADIIPPDGVLSIISKLKSAGYKALLCGGCVRDAILGNTAKDWDIATSALPDEVEKLFDKTVAVGKSFGVIRVIVDSTEFEVATFRNDSNTGDGRRPESVNFTNEEEDVKRRDFTVNGLLYDIDERNIIDYVGGIYDLENKVIRTIGNPEKRFMEDYLRILRGVRFASTLSFSLEPEPYKMICQMAGLLNLISKERVTEEFSKMLQSGKAGNAFRLMEETNILQHTIPELTLLKGMPQPPRFHPEGDVFTHTAMMLDQLKKGCDLRLAYAVLLHDIGKPQTLSVSDRIRFSEHEQRGAIIAEQILRRLKLPNKLVNDTTTLINDHMRIVSLRDMRPAKLRRFLRDELFELHMELHRLDCTCSHNKLDIYDFAMAEHEKEMSIPLPPEKILTGNDLIELGYKAGPEFKKILTRVEDAQLENAIKDKKGAIEFVLSNFPDKG